MPTWVARTAPATAAPKATPQPWSNDRSLRSKNAKFSQNTMHIDASVHLRCFGHPFWHPFGILALHKGKNGTGLSQSPVSLNCAKWTNYWSSILCLSLSRRWNFTYQQLTSKYTGILWVEFASKSLLYIPASLIHKSRFERGLLLSCCRAMKSKKWLGTEMSFLHFFISPFREAD